MTQTLIATELTLKDLRDRFNLSRTQEQDFFTEWAIDADSQVSLTAAEQQTLDRVQQNYLSQLEAQLMNEETVKMVVVSPLLDAAGFYRAPFQIDSEVSIEISAIDEGDVTGRIDTLIIRQQLWILVIESKRSRFSVQAAIPQALAYLLAKPQPEKPGFALLTNGGEFLLIKLQQQEIPTYDFSSTFSLLNPGNDLYKVLSILKKIGEML
jgi:Type I restriction enzyme R protein N terminus (HSDR_N)